MICKAHYLVYCGSSLYNSIVSFFHTSGSEQLQTTGSEAYNVVGQTGRTVEGEYEEIPLSTSSHPTTTTTTTTAAAAAAGDYKLV